MSTSIPTFPPRPRGATIPVWAVVVISAVAGFGGALLSFWLFPQFRQAQIPPGTEYVVVQQPGQVIVKDDTDLRQIRTQISPQIVGFYRGGDVGTGRLVAAGVMLTSDGWFVSTVDAKLLTTDLARVGHKTYSIKQITTDQPTMLTFGKLAADSGQRFALAQPAGIAGRFPGLSAFYFGPDGLTVRTSLITDAFFYPVGRENAVSDRLSYALATTTPFAAPITTLPGTPIFDLSGAVVGLATSAPTVLLPSDVMSDSLTRILGKTITTVTDLKFNYEYTIGDGTPNTSGAVLTGVLPKNMTSSGLKSGDIIVAVNDTVIDSPNRLFLLFRAAAGKDITVKYRRADQPIQTTTIIVNQTPSKK